MNLREHREQILQEIYCIVRHNHQGTKSFTPTGEVVELMQYHNIRYHHACAIHEVTNEPQPEVFTVGLCLSRIYHEMKATEIDQERMPKSICIPLQKLGNTKTFAFNTNSVEVWMLHEEVLLLSGVCTSCSCVSLVLLVFKVEQSEEHDWQRGHGDIVKLIDEWFVERLAREHGPEAKEELCGHIQNILVEGIQDQ